MKVLLAANWSAVNLGCEAIDVGTTNIIGDKVKQIIYSTTDPNESKILKGKPTCVTQLHYKELFLEKAIRYSICKILGKCLVSPKKCFATYYEGFAQSNVSLFVGGDCYCYPNNDWLYQLQKLAKKYNNTTVLWGASIEFHNNEQTLKKYLNHFDFLFLRESLSYQTVKGLGIDNVFLFPDPAFTLECEKCELPAGFLPNKTIALNISPFISKYNAELGRKNVLNLIKFILNNTDNTIMMFPHVKDDLKEIEIFRKMYLNDSRIIFCNNDFLMNSRQIKYVISNCRLAIVARTHASIAAYSTLVPTLVMSYSIKSKGIAKDLFGSYNNYLVSLQELTEENELCNAFEWLAKNENTIRQQLTQIMPEYIKRAYFAGDKLIELCKK